MSGTNRLAAFRAQRERPSQSNVYSNGNDSETHEMTVVGSADGTSTSSGFLSEITSLQSSLSQLSSNIRTISSLHQRSLNSGPDGQDHISAITSTLEESVADTRTLINSIKGRIQGLAEETESLAKKGKITQGDVKLRVDRLNLIKKKFLECIQDYQVVERDFNAKSRQRAERQFRIVKPDATAEELKQATNGGDMRQIFTQATLDQPSTQYATSRTAYNEVLSRQNDISRIERTLAELTSLTQDIALLVDQQDYTVANVEDTARDVEKNTKAGEEHTNRAVELARSIRRKKWWCFWLSFLILLIIGLAVGLSIGLKK